MDTSTTPKTTLIGRTIAGRFRITGFIGEGAMATVYRGVQEREPHDIAVKVMHPHLINEDSFVKRFRREAKAASALKHPNTVQIFDFGVDNQLPFIAMELLSGQDLFELLVTEKQLDQGLAVRILIQVCDALAAAHELGIVHRDLKPENVMLLRDPENPDLERVKVLDFGIAKIVDRADKEHPDEALAPMSVGDSVLTTVGVIVGTPQYMSPEQCRASPVDARSDIYSCGILLYQLVTGRVPFMADHPFEIAMKQVREAPPPPSTFVPAIHPALERVILKALEKWPAQRQQNALELRNELLAVLSQLPDNRRSRLSWAVAPGSAFERRSASSSRSPSSGRPSEPSTMRSPEAAWPDGNSDKQDLRISIETKSSRDQLVTTLASASTPDPQIPGRVSAPPRHPPAPIDVISAPPGRPKGSVEQAAKARKPHHSKRKRPNWIMLPIAIGIGIGVGVLAYIVMVFATH